VVAGIRLSVVTPGPVAVGDPVRLLRQDQPKVAFSPSAKPAGATGRNRDTDPKRGGPIFLSPGLS
jgi:hypothetical protein